MEFKLIRHKFNTDIKVYPISDVHYGALEHMQDEWKAFCKMVERSDNTYLVLNGDLVNNNIRSAKFANPFDEIVRPQQQKYKMVEFLEPIKDRILCIVAGNHEYRTTKETDQDITYDIAAKLDLEHLYQRDIAFMKLSLGTRRRSGDPKVSYTVAAVHGAGGGGSTGAAVNKNEIYGRNVDGLDCLIVGHTHKGAITKPEKIVIDCINNRVSLKKFVCVSCVSWVSYGGYAARGMMLPTATADPQELTFKCDEANKRIITRW